MVEILKIRARWNFGWGNSPDLEILIDRYPPRADYRFAFVPHELGKNKLAGSYWAEVGGHVHFFGWNGRQDRGYGGRHFPIRLLDGTEVVLKGPWSSGTYWMNKLFPHAAEVSITDEPETWERGYTFCASTMLVSKIREALQHLRPELVLELDPRWVERGDPVYCVQCADGRYRPSHTEAVEWGDKPAETNDFRELRVELGLDTPEAQKQWCEEWQRPHWEKHMGPLSVAERGGRAGAGWWKRCKQEWLESQA